MIQLRHVLILALGLVSASSSVIFIKASRLDPVLLATGRLSVAAVVVAPFFWRAVKAHAEFFRRHRTRTLWPGFLFGIHFISWIVGARMTPAVNSSLLVNMVPLVTPFFLRVVARETLLPAERTATALAFAGVLWLAGWDYKLSREYFLGDLVCFGSMILFALYLAFGRANRDFPNVWLYMWPVYMAAGVCCLSIAVFVTDFQAQPFDAREGLLLVGLGVVPTVIGHGSINYALKHLRGQAVGVANLSQVLFAGLLAYLLLGEVPELAFYPAGALIALGVFLAFKKRGAASA